MKSTVQYHLDHPNVTTDDYVRSQHLQWGRAVMARKRIYLDTRFWIMLRDVYIGRSGDPDLSALLSTLQAMVSSDEALCPITETTFLELLRHRDASTRRTTAELVDELRAGACLFPHADRLGIEMEYWAYSWLGYVSHHAMAHKVWTKLAWAFGVTIPHETGFDSAQESAVQKGFFDHMWTVSLVDMVDVVSAKAGENDMVDEKREFDAIAQRLNESNRLHADDWNSFTQIYRAELIGIIEEFAPMVLAILHRDRPSFTRKHQDARREFCGDAQTRLMSVFYEAIRKSGLRQTLRTAHIGASCFASIRHDRGRKLTGNDLHDFRHAGSAIGYCDVFLSDGPLAVLLRKGNLHLAEDFPCEVFSSPAEAVRALA